MAAERSVDTGTEQLLCSIRHGVAALTLNRPEARNALSPEMTPALVRQSANGSCRPASLGDPGPRRARARPPARSLIG